MQQELRVLFPSCESTVAFILQALSAEMASRDSELEAQTVRCQAKDTELASLAQQIEHLQAAAEAQAQVQTEAAAQAAQHEQSMQAWAVNVSLDQGIAAGPSVMLPTSPTALRSRVQTLEVW